MKNDNRVWLSNKVAPISKSLEKEVDADTIKGVFWAPGMEDSCHLYVGSFSGNSGYGQIELGFGKNVRCKMGTHVLAWIIAHPLRRLRAHEQVTHRCDVRSCRNPRHLRLGDAEKNAWERGIRGCVRDRKLLHREVEAQIMLRQLLKKEIPVYLRREAGVLGLVDLLKKG